jgi:RNA polymerase sigma-70 factor (ECF subfamily)
MTQPDPEKWLEEHGDALYRYAMLHVRDSSVAEDLVQEALLAALKGADRFAGRSSERTWLTGILRHKIIDYIRKSGRQTEAGELDATSQCVEGQFGKGGKWKPNPANWGGQPDAALEQREFWDVLRECLTALPPRMVAAFTAREVDGRDSDEICQELGVSATNLWTLLYRARLGLRRCLESNWFRRAPRDEAS